MDKETLDKLIADSIRKDEKAFRQLVEEFQSLIYSLAFRMLANESEAEDAVQETFIRLWLHLKRYDQKKKFTTWLYVITTNICLDKLKVQSYTRRSLPSDEEIRLFISQDDVELNLINKDLAEMISVLSEGLSPKQKIVFTLHYLEDLSINEIREITGMSAIKIKNNLYVARKIIRSKIDKLNQ